MSQLCGHSKHTPATKVRCRDEQNYHCLQPALIIPTKLSNNSNNENILAKCCYFPSAWRSHVTVHSNILKYSLQCYFYYSNNYLITLKVHYCSSKIICSIEIIESFEVIELIDLTQALNLGKPSWTNSNYL